MPRKKTGKQKKCIGCNHLSNTNKSLVTHMLNSSKCKKFILYCIGCSKPHANETHLQNHQTQQQNHESFTYCIQGSKKLDYVNTLSLDNLPNQIKNQTMKKRKFFTIEQEINDNRLFKKSKNLIPTIDNPTLCLPTNSNQIPHASSLTYIEQNQRKLIDKTKPQSMVNINNLRKKDNFAILRSSYPGDNIEGKYQSNNLLYLLSKYIFISNS